MHLCKITNWTESDYKKAIYNSAGDIEDIADLAGKTPFDDLLSEEEKTKMLGDADIREAQCNAISGLLSYLLKDKNPHDVLKRVFLLAYTIRPELIDGMTLAGIGDHLGGHSKQTVGYALKKQDEWLQYRGRNRKTDKQKASQAESTRRQWKQRRAATQPSLL